MYGNGVNRLKCTSLFQRKACRGGGGDYDGGVRVFMLCMYASTFSSEMAMNVLLFLLIMATPNGTQSSPPEIQESARDTETKEATTQTPEEELAEMVRGVAPVLLHGC